MCTNQMIYFSTFHRFYRIEKLGKLWSKRQKRYLTPTKDKDGYLRHQLTDENGKRYQCKVHRMVALKYILITDTDETVNHIDNDKTNNRVDNLEWMTRSQNTHLGNNTRWNKPTMARR